MFRIPLLAVTLVATATLLHAEDKTDNKTDSDGYHIVPVTVGGHTVPVRVKEQKDPFHNVKTSSTNGKYDPEHIFSHTSGYADKPFSMQADLSTQGGNDLKEQDREKFVTKAYTGNGLGPDKNGAHTKVDATEASTFNKGSTGFSKNFDTASASEASHTAVLDKDKSAQEQSRAANLGGPEKSSLIAENSLANKQYLGPGAQHVPTNVEIKENVVLSHVNEIPSRPMTIDEVRDLINHGAKPDTTVKPSESSKPLNDPAYKAEPLRIAPEADSQPAPSLHTHQRTLDDDSSDSVPSPGMMSDPHPQDDSDKLPQR